MFFSAEPVLCATVRFEVASKVSTSDLMAPQQRGRKNVGGHFFWLLTSY